MSKNIVCGFCWWCFFVLFLFFSHIYTVEHSSTLTEQQIVEVFCTICAIRVKAAGKAAKDRM